MVLLRLIVILIIPLAIVYVSLLMFLLARKREQLEAGFQPAAAARDRETFVEAGVRAYAERLRPRLAVVVFGVPVTGLLVYGLTSNGL